MKEISLTTYTETENKIWGQRRTSLFHYGNPYHIESSPLICSANQWIGFYMMGASVLKELRTLSKIYDGIILQKYLTTKRNWLTPLAEKLHRCSAGLLFWKLLISTLGPNLSKSTECEVQYGVLCFANSYLNKQLWVDILMWISKAIIENGFLVNFR